VTLEDWMRSDEDAAYAERIRIDVSNLSPMVARPADPGNGIDLASLPEEVPVQIGYGGSCTGGKREDFDAYHEVLAWAAEQGLAVAPGVKLFLQFGTVNASCPTVTLSLSRARPVCHESLALWPDAVR
jgi:3-isopropylmalate/(R)-2-methylmalate dehydratase large subunit